MLGVWGRLPRIQGSEVEEAFDDAFGKETDYAKNQADEHDEGAESASLGLLRQIPDDEHHQPDQYGQTDVKRDLFELFDFHGLANGVIRGTES